MLLDKVVKVSQTTRDDYKVMTSNWNVLAKHINHLTTYELLCFIKLEKEESERPHIINRLYSRFSKLRRQSELREVLAPNE